jgi:predicted secreted hydrolase
MDKEISTSQLGPRQVGWDWFSLQLDDGRELMLFLLRDAGGGTDFASATLVDSQGRPTYLRSGDFTVRATGRWTSPETGTTYPSGWRIELPGHALGLSVEPLVEAQENVARLARDLRYWEGAVRVLDSGGQLVGRGYVELTGYGEGNRPPV